MNIQEFQQFVSGKIRYLDGATGSNLMKEGMPSGVCPEKWILEHKDICLSLQKAYIEAGTDILYCPTFSANRIKLREYGLEDQQKQMIKDLVSISAQAASLADHKVLIAGDITMTGKQLAPMGTLQFEDLIDIYKEQISDLEDAGVDLLIVETMMSLQETRAALIAAKECSRLPVMVTLSFEKGGRTLFGTDALAAAVCLEKLGAAAIGANCSTGPAEMANLIKTMTQAVSIPVIAKPNAGLPVLDEEGKTGYSMNAKQFAEEMVLLVKEGASILGGCCGTDPEYIKHLKEKTKDMLPLERKKVRSSYLTSERCTILLGLHQDGISIGNKIKIDDDKELLEELLDDDYDTILDWAQDQEDYGAEIININIDIDSVDSKPIVLRTIQEIGSVTNLPLSMSCRHTDVLEKALRHYCGRALIYDYPEDGIEELLELAVKYGAVLVFRPMSYMGSVKDTQVQKQMLQFWLDRAMASGLAGGDIIVADDGSDSCCSIINDCFDLGLNVIHFQMIS